MAAKPSPHSWLMIKSCAYIMKFILHSTNMQPICMFFGFRRWHDETYDAVSGLWFTLVCLVDIKSCVGLDMSNQNPKLIKVPVGLSKNITKLDLSKNEISELGADNFTGLDSMEDLDLQSNRIAHIDDLAFLSCASLTRLNLNGNQIVYMPETFGPNSHNIIRLFIHENPCIIKVPWFRQFRSLESLRLDGYAMEELPNDLFGGLLNLKQLIVGSSNAPNLTEKTVDLAFLTFNNPIVSTFPNENFMNLKKLTTVMMTSDGGPAITPPRFLGAVALYQLWLLLEVESLPDLSHLPSLRTLVFSTSSLVCDHRLCWALFESFTFSLGALETGCSNPPSFSGRGIYSITKLELGCYDSKLLQAVASHHPPR